MLSMTDSGWREKNPNTGFMSQGSQGILIMTTGNTMTGCYSQPETKTMMVILVDLVQEKLKVLTGIMNAIMYILLVHTRTLYML